MKFLGHTVMKGITAGFAAFSVQNGLVVALTGTMGKLKFTTISADMQQAKLQTSFPKAL